MNEFFMLGRLTKDPEMRTTTTGTSVCNFSVAVDRNFKREGEPEADFFNCTAFGKRAEVIGKYFQKGKPIQLRTEVRNNNYEKDGVKHYGFSFIVNDFSFVPNDKTANNNPNNQDYVPDGFTVMDDDEDVPF